MGCSVTPLGVEVCLYWSGCNRSHPARGVTQCTLFNSVKYYIDYNLEEAGEVEKRLVEKNFSMIMVKELEE